MTIKRSIQLLIAVAVLYFLWNEISPSPEGEILIVKIPTGASLQQASQILKKEEIIRSRLLFRLFTEFYGISHEIKAGEYRFQKRMPYGKVLKKLVEGSVVQYPVTIPEGYTIEEIARVLEAKEICSAEAFHKATQDSELLASLRVEAPTAEGFLFPETYRFAKGTSASKIVETMVHKFWDIYDREFMEKTMEIEWTPLQVVTLASIIEKESTLNEERAVISAVFHNRLRKNMLLQSDPTVLYGLGIYSGAPTKKQLETKTPYNTYRIKGLPIGPIGNPGEASIKAALHPANVPYLYFVSRNDGSHAFSTTLREHIHYALRYQEWD